jgi:hypothetical protein
MFLITFSSVCLFIYLSLNGIIKFASSEITVSYPRRLLTCAPEKGGSRNWISLTKELSYATVEAYHKYYKSGNDINGNLAFQSISITDLKDFMNDHNHSNAWIKIVAVRDPLERFLSGYLDKCVKMKDSNCINFPTSNVTFADFVRKIYNLYEENNSYMINHFNTHWKLQSSQCGPLSNYDNVVKWSQYDSILHVKKKFFFIIFFIIIYFLCYYYYSAK